MASFSLTPIEPLEVEIRGAGQHARVETVEEMIAFLTSEWPDKTKPGFHSALARSIDAMVMAAEPAAARAAFVDAAHATGMHIFPDDMAEIRNAS
ncbi:DUF982 domain-containing protein [Rhizobium sp. 2MFCol3.1]|uniref:DUF982 domain-containing protein n=1 Tax=Rhizobium sp. 2MFCol3.1 TaxID=1246459 RepID=UPI00036F6CB0|nr:DUF982 domain-containing protein [Rhizobium sp. 2MFCol3.1]